MDACVPLSSSFATLTCGWTKEWQLLVALDPSQDEQCMCLCTCVVKSDSGDVISFHMDGFFSVPQVSEDFSRQELGFKEHMRQEFACVEYLEIVMVPLAFLPWTGRKIQWSSDHSSELRGLSSIALDLSRSIALDLSRSIALDLSRSIALDLSRSRFR